MPLPDMLTPVESKAIATHVYQQLRQAIRVGQLKPGERLIDSELAVALHVSRATVREALRLLESKGLVVNNHRRGTYVATLTTADLRDISNFRSLLEAHAARVGARTITTAELDELQSTIDDLYDAGARQDFEAIVDLDLHFHLVICRLARSKHLLETWLGMETMLRAFLLLKYDIMDDSSLIAGGHEPILEALRAGDGELAARLLPPHIMETAERVLVRLEAERGEEGASATGQSGDALIAGRLA
jgi:GntR family transcriptional regulator, gluconate operon transcriptional repressor